MARMNRLKIGQEEGSYHIISRTTGQDFLLNDESKDHFLSLMSRFCMGFFVQLHSFCIMTNHFHMLVTNLDGDALEATDQELFRRYKILYGRDYELQVFGMKGRQKRKEIEKLRKRLSSISCFVQELKQTFSRWYNKKTGRKGYFWCDRFNGVLVERGKAQIHVSAYIDLNPVRAGIVSRPQDYKWCSFSMERSGLEANFLSRLTCVCSENDFSGSDYETFVYECAGISANSKNVVMRERIGSLTSSFVLGSRDFVLQISRSANKKERVKLLGNMNGICCVRQNNFP